MGKKRKNINKLSPAEIEEFKAMLLAKRNEILCNVTFMEDEALRREHGNLSNMPIHMADLGTDAFEQEFTLGLMEGERKLLLEINDALSRIKNDTYGICEGTGEPIPKLRLGAIPWARYCVTCASLLEKGLVGKENSFDESDHDGRMSKEQNEDSDEPDEDRLS